MLHLAPMDRLEQGFAGWKMPVEGAYAHAGGARDGSRLASAPPALKTARAASRSRSRLRTASMRGFRMLRPGCDHANRPIGRVPCITEAPSVYRHEDALSYSNDTPSHNTRAMANVGATKHSSCLDLGGHARTIVFGAPHKPIDDFDHKRREAHDRHRRPPIDAARPPPRTPQLTGTKKGCDRGQCGACAVIVDGRRINCCLALAISHDGAEVLTIEGVRRGDRLHPVRKPLSPMMACNAASVRPARS